jgi:ribosomal protein S18 acetylase RimI-like enzyme
MDMTMNFKLRAATLDDLSQLRQLMYDLHDDHHQQVPEFFNTAEEIEKTKDIEKYLNHPECYVYVMHLEGSDDLVAFATGHFSDLKSLVSPKVKIGCIDELYVLPQYRRHGFADKLCARLEQEFAYIGAKEVFIEVWDFNKPALSLYDKLGYSKHIHWIRKSIASHDDTSSDTGEQQAIKGNSQEES